MGQWRMNPRQGADQISLDHERMQRSCGSAAFWASQSFTARGKLVENSFMKPKHDQMQATSKR